MTTRNIQSVTVLGAGTMGSGIAAACATAGCQVNLLDVSSELSERGKQNMLQGRTPMLDDSATAELIKTGSFKDSLTLARESDWICEAVVEDLDVKRKIFGDVEAVRKDHSIVSTNTSGIPLKSIYEGMPDRFRKDVAVTHFFNPVKVMRLLELVPGEDTTQDVIDCLAQFCRSQLGKGVVYAKDTVNFIGNRIGCFWMLAGFHAGREARKQGIDVARADSLMSSALGIPSTGLYGLIDLVGLDVMQLVATNLEHNLPADDQGRCYVRFPSEEQAMFDAGQLGRKTGGGFYRMLKNEDGSRQKQMFDPQNGTWSDVVATQVELEPADLILGTSNESAFVWNLVSETLCYAADLVPDISDDIVNVDRAMRWGFNWKSGPFELLDQLGAETVIDRLLTEGRMLPKMLKVLKDSGQSQFYDESATKFLGVDGIMHQIPAH